MRLSRRGSENRVRLSVRLAGFADQHHWECPNSRPAPRAVKYKHVRHMVSKKGILENMLTYRRCLSVLLCVLERSLIFIHTKTTPERH